MHILNNCNLTLTVINIIISAVLSNLLSSLCTVNSYHVVIRLLESLVDRDVELSSISEQPTKDVSAVVTLYRNVVENSSWIVGLCFISVLPNKLNVSQVLLVLLVAYEQIVQCQIHPLGIHSRKCISRLRVQSESNLLRLTYNSIVKCAECCVNVAYLNLSICNLYTSLDCSSPVIITSTKVKLCKWTVQCNVLIDWLHSLTSLNIVVCCESITLLDV